METYCFADGRCLFKQPQSVIYHCNQYDEEILKMCWGVCLSVNISVRSFVSVNMSVYTSMRVYIPLRCESGYIYLHRHIRMYSYARILQS